MVILALVFMFGVGYSLLGLVQEGIAAPMGPSTPAAEWSGFAHSYTTGSPAKEDGASTGQKTKEQTRKPPGSATTCDDVNVLVDRSHSLPSDYVPTDLVSLQDYRVPTLVLRHRGFDKYMTLALYRGENAGGTDVKKVYVVDLTMEERSELLKLVGKGEVRARKMNRAHILLLADEDRTDKDIAEALHTSPSTVERTRRRLVEGGLEQALNESARPGGRRKLTGKQEAYLVALACSDPPEGKKRWSMQLLADRLVELDLVEEISEETVRRTLKKGMLSRG